MAAPQTGYGSAYTPGHDGLITGARWKASALGGGGYAPHDGARTSGGLVRAGMPSHGWATTVR